MDRMEKSPITINVSRDQLIYLSSDEPKDDHIKILGIPFKIDTVGSNNYVLTSTRSMTLCQRTAITEAIRETRSNMVGLRMLECDACAHMENMRNAASNLDIAKEAAKKSEGEGNLRDLLLPRPNGKTDLVLQNKEQYLEDIYKESIEICNLLTDGNLVKFAYKQVTLSNGPILRLGVICDVICDLYEAADYVMNVCNAAYQIKKENRSAFTEEEFIRFKMAMHAARMARILYSIVIKFHTDTHIEYSRSSHARLDSPSSSIELRKKSLNASLEEMFYAKFVKDLVESNPKNAETCKKVFSKDENFVKNLLDGTIRTDAEKAYKEQFQLLLDDPKANVSDYLKAILTNDPEVPLAVDLADDHMAQLTDFFSILV
ncbi:MAG: hypothetical protein LBI61_03075 [Puniceicoccales bacterium]|jgi:hypothetical protein|nr:hypothetical protein [Puniceicoccales bacterium]